jgi:dCMP deaminase
VDLKMAEFVASASKDPSTQTGAVIVDERRRVVSVGFNGFPPGIADTPERLNDRPTKYKLIVHAERNAVVNSQRSVEGCTLYTWPFSGCTSCVVLMLAAGLKRSVSPVTPDDKLERWEDDLIRARSLWIEAGAVVSLYGPDGLAEHYAPAKIEYSSEHGRR